jgi:hypothetical protein
MPLQAGVVYAGTALGFAISGFAALNLAFTGIWILLAARSPGITKNNRAPGANDRAP